MHLDRKLRDRLRTRNLQVPKNCVLTPLVFFKTGPTIGKKPNENQESLNVEIKTQSGEANSKIVLIYVLIFKTVISKALLKFFMLLKD